MTTRKPEPPESLDLFAPRAPPPARPPGPAADGATQQALRAPIPDDGGRSIAAPQKPSFAPEAPRSYRVSELVRLAGRTLEARFPDVWVEGDISNLKAPGHLYFTLKDEEGQLPAVMFRGSAQRLRFRPTDGLKVRARGRLAIYDAQGKLQLYVESLEPVGLGALQLAFEQLKRRLAAEGLFDEARKRRLPFLPRRIGVATSASGAAVRDIIRVAQRRGPVSILVAPCLVQGDAAPADIVRALAALQRQPGIDLVIVGRGGGSTEDLWAFNDEAVARAIAACRVPVISAVGHEVDFTIADMVADRRAATPSQAAELAVPVHAEIEAGLTELRSRLVRAGRRTVGDARTLLDDQRERMASLVQRRIDVRQNALHAISGRLGALHPRARLARDRLLLDALERRLLAHAPERLGRARRALDPLVTRLHAAMQRELARRDQLAPLSARLEAAAHAALAQRRRRFAEVAGKLDALSPLKVLDRGYGLVRDPAGRVITRPGQLAPGDRMTVALARGTVTASVLAVEENAEPGEQPARQGDAS